MKEQYLKQLRRTLNNEPTADRLAVVILCRQTVVDLNAYYDAAKTFMREGESQSLQDTVTKALDEVREDAEKSLKASQSAISEAQNSARESKDYAEQVNRKFEKVKQERDEYKAKLQKALTENKGLSTDLLISNNKLNNELEASDPLEVIELRKKLREAKASTRKALDSWDRCRVHLDEASRKIDELAEKNEKLLAANNRQSKRIASLMGVRRK